MQLAASKVLYVLVLFNVGVVFSSRRVSVQQQHVVEWDPSKTKKLAPGTRYDLNVFINDKMDIFCPQYDTDAAKSKTLKFIIYNVSKESFEKCKIIKDESRQIFECNQPNKPKKLTTKFQERSPNPLGFVFKPDSSYYYMAFKDFNKQGCENAMRMTIKVEIRRNHHNKATKPIEPPSETPKTKPSATTLKTTTTTLMSKIIKKPTPRNDQLVGRSTTTTSGANSRLRSASAWLLSTFITLLLILQR